MRRSLLRRTALPATLFIGALMAIGAVAADKLHPYNVDIRKTSVSGLSSGAAMAVQLDVAYSSIFSGAGIIAGAPYACAHGLLTTAQGPCMAATMPIDVAELVNVTRKSAENGEIDAVANLRNQRIWLFSGGKDSVVKRSVVIDVEKYYKSFVASANVLGECWDRTSANAHRACVQAQHAMPTKGFGRGCSVKHEPYINDCGFDAAGALLKWIYPGIRNRSTSPPRDRLLEFDQSEFISVPALHGMAATGWVFVPENCQRQKPCRLHVALHGCLQHPGHVYADENHAMVKFGDTFARHAGYNEWADANNIIVLYPQAASIPPFMNPSGCWDWWGYTGADYAKKNGTQMAAIRSMIDRVTGHR